MSPSKPPLEYTPPVRKTPGYYWARHKDGTSDMVYVMRNGMVEVMGSDAWWEVSDFVEWSERIEKPEGF
jgi:hypothetical protein